MSFATMPHVIAMFVQLLLSTVLLPVIMFLVSAPVIITGSLSAMSVSVIAVYASLLIISHAIGNRVMTVNSRALVMVIPVVLVADAAAMLAGMNWYGAAVLDLLFHL